MVSWYLIASRLSASDYPLLKVTANDRRLDYILRITAQAGTDTEGKRIRQIVGLRNRAGLKWLLR